jgi:hypothetical protein
MDDIKELAVRIAAEQYNLDPSWLMCKTRKEDIVKARQLASYLLTHVAGYGITEIGEFLGQDHASINHSRKTIRNKYLLKTAKGKPADLDFIAMVDRCSALLPARNSHSLLVVLKKSEEVSPERMNQIKQAIIDLIPELNYIKVIN